MAHIPQIKEVNGKIHGAKRLVRTPKHEKNNGYTAFVRCIHFIQNKYCAQDLEMFVQFKHDAWNVCDSNDMHPLYHAAHERDSFHKGANRAIADGRCEFTVKWYNENVALMDRVIAKICEHIDITDLGDKQVVQVVDMLTENNGKTWVAGARRRLIDQGLGITRFPKIDGEKASLPMLVARRARYGGDVSIIKEWLDDGVAHDPPDGISGYGLMRVLEEIEQSPPSVIFGSRPQIIDIAKIMRQRLGGNGLGYNTAREMGRSSIEEISDMGIRATRADADGAIGFLDGVVNAKYGGRDLAAQKKTYMRGLEGIRGHVSTNSAVLMINLGSNILTPAELQQAIDVVRTSYGRAAYVGPESAKPMADRLVEGVFNAATMNMRAMDLKAVADQSRRLLHPDNVGLLDTAITRRLLDSVMFHQPTNVTRALVEFLGDGQRIVGADSEIDKLLCLWDRPGSSGMRADTYLINELLQAMTRSGWTPSASTPEIILEMVNTGISCAHPIVNLHLDNFKEHGVVEPQHLVGLFNECLVEPRDNTGKAVGYAGLYPWGPSDRWTAKSRVVDALVVACQRNAISHDIVAGACDDAMRNVLEQSEPPNEQVTGILKRLIDGCAWSYEKSADRVPAGGEHWLDEDSQALLDSYMSALSHGALEQNVEQVITPRRPGPRL